MTHIGKPYENEFQVWAQILPLLKVGTVYKFTPKYAQQLKEDNEAGYSTEFDTPLNSPKFVGLFKLISIACDGKYRADYKFTSLDGECVNPALDYIQIASDIYEEKDLDLMEDLGEIGL
jgi:hypothetical protein